MSPIITMPDGPVQVLGPFNDRRLSHRSRSQRIAIVLTKVILLVLLLYTFICSLTFLSSAFRLLGGKAAGKFISNSEILQNPIVGLMIGVLVTVLVQSSSTSTSIVVTMVGSDLIRVRQAIPIVMGANIGTSVTNTIVSLMQASEREEFRRAFAAATVHDMFNWLTVMVLLPLEAATGYLEYTTDAMMSMKEWKQDKGANSPDFLKTLTKPFTDSIAKLDKKVLEKIATSPSNVTVNDPILKICCSQLDDLNTTPLRSCTPNCPLLNRLNLSDGMSGILLLVFSLFLLCTCLIMVVKLLNSMLQGRIASLIKKYINSDYEFPLSMFVGYVAIFVGCIMTILVQSSSIFTSALTPLAGIGVISLERIYPLTLGSNIGTTTTGIMAALAADSRSLRNTLQLAFCHLLFNVTGILIFYPIPWMRFPIPLARMLGNTTVNYRWFSIFYLISMFFLLPFAVFALSCAGHIVFGLVGIPVAFTLFVVVVINIIQSKRKSWLPFALQTWDWLPMWMHSLDPIDRVITRITSHCPCMSCIQSESRHDAGALGIRANQSQLHILEAAKPLSASEAHLMSAFENTGYYQPHYVHHTWTNGASGINGMIERVNGHVPGTFSPPTPPSSPTEGHRDTYFTHPLYFGASTHYHHHSSQGPRHHSPLHQGLSMKPLNESTHL